jgi:hypothetical protein
MARFTSAGFIASPLTIVGSGMGENLDGSRAKAATVWPCANNFEARLFRGLGVVDTREHNPRRSTAMSRFIIVSAKESAERTLMTPRSCRSVPPTAPASKSA